MPQLQYGYSSPIQEFCFFFEQISSESNHSHKRMVFQTAHESQPGEEFRLLRNLQAQESFGPPLDVWGEHLLAKND